MDGEHYKKLQLVKLERTRNCVVLNPSDIYKNNSSPLKTRDHFRGCRKIVILRNGLL